MSGHRENRAMRVCYKIRREIEGLFPPRTTAAERLVGLLIADQARRATRIAVITDDTIFSTYTGLDEKTVQRTLRTLRDKRHLEFRVTLGTGTDGRPYYSFRGHRPEFRVPTEDEFRNAWILCGDTVAALPEIPWICRYDQP